MLNYFHIYTNTSDVDEPEEKFGDELERTALCAGPPQGWERIALSPGAALGCREFKMRISDFSWAVETRPLNLPVSFFFGFGVGIIRNDLLELFSSMFDVRAQMVLAPIKNASGKTVETHQVFSCLNKIVIRGDIRSGFRVCDKCKTLSYAPVGKRYVTTTMPPGVSIAESQYNHLVVNENAYQRIAEKKIKHLRAEKIPYVTTPQDGLDMIELTADRLKNLPARGSDHRPRRA